MLLAFAILIAFAGVLALGGHPGRLADVRFARPALVFAALGLQVLIFTPAADVLSQAWHTKLHLLSYLLLLAFLWLNARRPGVWLAALGFAANTLAIFSNGGRMPVSLEAWAATGRDPSALQTAGSLGNNVVASADTRLAWLGDVFPLPSQLPFASALSVGDMLILAGMTAFLYRACRPARVSSPRRTLAPLRVRDFRLLLAGRMASKVGDWLTLTAVATWIFTTTHSTVLVSIFLIARILSAMAGAVAAAPLLDRLPHGRLLSVVEVGRGVLTLLALPFAAGGRLWVVIALVCTSYFLGSATNAKAASFVPDLLPPELVHAGNALHGVSREVVMLVGAVVGGLTVSVFGITTALAVDLVSFSLAAALYVRFSEPVSPRATSDVRPAARIELVRVLARRRVLVGLTVSFTVVTAAMGLLNASLPAFFATELGHAEAYGYALAALAAGLLAGQFLTSFAEDENVARRSVGLSFLASGLLLLVLSASTTAAMALLLLFLVGLADGTTEAIYDTIFQLDLAPPLRAGAFALAGALQNGGMIVGLALAPLLAGGVDPARSLAIAGVVCGVGAAIATVTLARPARGERRLLGART
jgi:predicted MFS family arabinose efflux permease